MRVRMRSLPTYRQALMGELEPVEYVERGRTMARSPSRSGRERDTLEHVAYEWERRRSRSPPRRAAARGTATVEQHFFDPLITVPAMPAYGGREWDFDPMVQESLVAPVYNHPAICYYPNGDDRGAESPVYVPTSGPFAPGGPLSTLG